MESQTPSPVKPANFGSSSLPKKRGRPSLAYSKDQRQLFVKKRDQKAIEKEKQMASKSLKSSLPQKIAPKEKLSLKEKLLAKVKPAA